jgi:WhiB family redox-sensing transcriptional regulator
MNGWRDRAACRDTSGLVFFPDPGDRVAEAVAKRMCGGCVVRAECLDYAVAVDAEVGIFGGLTASERGVLDLAGMIRTAPGLGCV